jgi:tetratricopeptide (TPR) repeat protein
MAEDAAARMRVLGAAATASGRPVAGARTLRTALHLVDSRAPAPQDAPLKGRILLSLAHAEAEQGNVAAGLKLLDEAADLLTDQTVVYGQRGLFLARTGRAAEASRELDRAVDALHAAGDPVELSRALLNRAYARLVFGLVGEQIAPTRADLLRSLRLAREHGLRSVAIKATQNLGSLDFLAGNLPRALRHLDNAARECAEHLPSYLPSIAVDKARALLAAGLAADAGNELDAAIGTLRRRRLSEDHAEAELVRAAAALLAGQPDTAIRWASAARRRFLCRQNQTGAALADLIRLRADFSWGSVPAAVARRGVRLSRRLAQLGLADDAQAAVLLAARAYLRAGRVERAAGAAGSVPPPGPAAPLDLQLLWHLALAELATARGQPSSRADHLRSGLARLHQRRSMLGSIDLQTGIAVHGRELAAAGVAAAVADGRVELVFEWTELARAQAFRVLPVRPPQDHDAARALAELRHLMFTLRLAERRGDPVAELVRRREQLERGIRERGWLRSGTGASTPVATLPAVLGRLGGDTMVIYLRHQRLLAALVLGAGSATLVPLGPYAPVEEAVRRLLADLDTVASSALPARMAAVLTTATRYDSEKLAALAIEPLRHLIGGERVVILPTGALFTAPWLHLRPLAGRAVVVVPSASAWLRTQEGRPAPLSRDRPPVLVAGPGVRHAEREIGSIGAILPGATRLTGTAATPAATLDALDGAPMAHIAAHGHHEGGNAMFSSLELSGGALMGYDLQELPSPPRHVVLSACELGMSNVRAGDEILGMVAALLAGGSETVVASVSRIADCLLPDLMSHYHRLVIGGSAPAQALTEASATIPHSPLVCFGAG